MVEERLRPEEVRWANHQTYGVVLAARGYPDSPIVGDPIEGLDTVSEGVVAFHAGTRLDRAGRLVSAGGRVLTLVGFDRRKVYRTAESVDFQGKQYRRDIGVETMSAVGVAP